MKILKDMSDFASQIKELYKKAFLENDDACYEYDLNAVTDLKKCYGLINGDELVSFVAVIEHTIIDENQDQHQVVLLGLLMTKPEYRGNHYGVNLINDVAKICMQEYESVLIQAENWDIYKSLDLIPTSIKKTYQYIPGVYPVPMIMTWNEPNSNLMGDIESLSSSNLCGILRPLDLISKNIELLNYYKLKFIANPFAYIWYDKQGNIELMSYESVAQLSWLLHNIKPTKEILLFDEPGIEEISCLKSLNKEVVVTKTFNGSKKIFKNVKIPDFIV